MQKTIVINAVGLTPSLLGAHTPNLAAFVNKGQLASVGPVLPAITTTVQSTYLTGATPAEHGIVGNGWYFRDECEIGFWRQCDVLVQRPRIWEKARQLDPAFTCANCFWWYAMYSRADVAITPRPMYPADGRKLPDVWTNPPQLRFDLQKELGQFPLFNFWGPATSIAASRWIAESAIRVDRRFNPTLNLIYLPHLDYSFQRFGPDLSHPRIQQDLRELDDVCGRLFEHFAKARIVVLSEYGIAPVSRPVHLNRRLRQAGLLCIREELGHELLDAGASRAFAVADHQFAHIYVNDASSLDQVRELIARTPGVAEVFDAAGKQAHHLDHSRSGELIAVAEPDAWFTYYYWLDDARCPDFARTVDIHRKPGYDPVELFLDPSLFAPKLKIAWKLWQRKLGLRTLLDVIPLDSSLVKGSHGRVPACPEDGPLLTTNQPGLVPAGQVEATAVYSVLMDHLAR
ncbi:MAG: nucleotide pyrophosphatase/phosphodiesterase family protein [Tepidisphaeraceae bacterium]|jgi:predicted AlkP superfamily pyrophosphatase or phosphodiesterase